jgi:nucleoside-diphosphate-sugar epimerase
MASILLTGAAGFVGRAVLAASGTEHRWTALDIGFPPNWSPGTAVTESAISDLSDPIALLSLVERVQPEAVVHLAGWTGKGSSVENRSRLLGANLVSTWNLLDAIASWKPERPVHFVLASSALVYGDQPGPFLESMSTRPSDEYAMTKWLAEEAVRAYGRRGLVLPTVVRPSVIYGPGQSGTMFVPSLARALASGSPFPMTAGEQKRDLLHVADAARAILSLVGSRAEGVYNIGTGIGVPMLDIGRKMARMAGRPDLLRPGEIPYRGNEVWDYAVDASRLTATTGWTPLSGLDDGLAETLEKEKNP